jgi:hypothetical protein
MAKAAPLDATLLGVPKGAAAPAPELGTTVASIPSTPSLPSAETMTPNPVRRSEPEVAPPPAEEARTALTVRLPISTQERLREASFRLRREKQSIVDEAVRAWLEARGY